MPGGSFAGPYSGNDSESIEYALVGKDLTISCWVKIPNDVTWNSLGSLGVFATMADLGGHNSAKSGFSIGAGNSGYPNWHAGFSATITVPGGVSSIANVTVNTTYKGGFQSPITWADDDWHLITVTYKFGATDGTDYQIYFDNAQTLGATSGTPYTAISTGGWTTIPGRRSGIGGGLTTSGGATAYKQREFVIWDRLLTPTERTTIYNSGVPLGNSSNYPSGAVAGWMFENNIEVDRTFYNSQQQYTGRVTLKNVFDNSKYAFVSNYDVFNRGNAYNPIQTNHISIPQVTNNPGLSSGMDTTNLVPSNLIKSIPYSGYSMLFEGDDWITTGISLDTLGVTTAFSVSCWVKITTNTNYDHLVGAPTSYAAWDTGFGLYLNGTGIRFWVEQWNGANQYVETAALNTGQWYHITAIFDTTNALKLYVDGSTITTASGTTIDGLTNTLYLGSTGANSTYALNGNLSNLAIFNRVLTTDEIIRIYNGGSPGDLTNLGPAAWWSLGVDSYFNGSNWICPDLSTNSNNGTSANMAAVNLVGDGPDSLANGTSTNLDLGSDLIGNAPGSTGNAISINMNSLAKTGSTP